MVLSLCSGQHPNHTHELQHNALKHAWDGNGGKKSNQPWIDQVKEEFGLIGGVPHFVFTLYGSQGNETKAVVTGAQNMDYFQIVLERAIKKANL